MKRAFVVAFVLAAACRGGNQPAETLPKGEAGDMEARVARIEAYIAKNAAAIEFLGLVFEQQQKQKAQQEEEEPAADAVFAVPVDENVKAGMVDGPASAPVTIVKAFDFTCPHCMRSNDVMKELVKQYGGKVRVVFKNLVVHPNAQQAHQASCAAAIQKKYLAYKDAFWEKGFKPYLQSGGQDESSLGLPSLLAIGKEVGLDVKKLEADMNGPTCRTLLEHDKGDLDKFRVTGTPTFFINGLMIPGALPKEGFVEMIDMKLKVAEASGVPGAQYYEKEILGKGEKQFRSQKQPKPAN